MRLLSAAGLLLAAVVAAVAGEPPIARAECDGPYPSFIEVAPSARDVVIGDVVEIEPVEWMGPDGRSSRFTLQAWSIRDGVGPIALPLIDMPSQPCAGPLFAGVGDRVAIAFAGRQFSTEVNAIAWVGGRKSDRAGIETLTVAQVYQAAGLKAPAVFPPLNARPAGSGFPWLLVTALVAVLLGGAAVLRRILA